jgi:hypothetical protein
MPRPSIRPKPPTSIHTGLRIFLLATALLAVPCFAMAESLISERFRSEHPDAELESVLYLSAGVALADLGYSSGREAKGAEYVLTLYYSRTGGEAALKLSLAAAKEGDKPVAEIEALIHLDLSLDDELAAALKRLFELARLGEPTAGGGTEIGGLFTQGLVNVANTLRTTKTLRLETLAYGGGLSFIGDFASYARFGATASLDAGLLRIRKSWSLSLGSRMTVTKAFLNDGVAGGNVYLSTAGLNLQLGVGAAQAQRLSASLSGGAAFLTVAGGAATLTKTVPYADAGLQAGFQLGKDFFLGADVRFLVVFDPDILIMGAVPTISLCKEF